MYMYQIWLWPLSRFTLLTVKRNVLLPRARMSEAGLSNGFCPSVCQSVCQQTFGLITTTKGLNTSKHHSNNDNSEKTVHGVPEGG